MAKSYSPLRYPGGKARIFNLVDAFIKINNLQRRHYAEPYAGGCGLALALLFHGRVSNIHINDIDVGVGSFWNIVLNRTDKLIETIYSTPVTIDEWHRQREILDRQSRYGEFKTGFAAFFLNRTNRSGIIKNAGAIGGQNQDGNFKIDCRFNKDELARKIRRIAKYKKRIHLYREDATDFMKYCEKHLPQTMIYYIDPPYYEKGSTLYTNFYNKEDHEKLAQHILALKKSWILTYDNSPEIKKFYASRRQFDFSLRYTATKKYMGSEVLIASKGIKVPPLLKEGGANF